MYLCLPVLSSRALLQQIGCIACSRGSKSTSVRKFLHYPRLQFSEWVDAGMLEPTHLSSFFQVSWG
jgi:hypothetical protein